MLVFFYLILCCLNIFGSDIFFKRKRYTYKNEKQKYIYIDLFCQKLEMFELVLFNQFVLYRIINLFLIMIIFFDNREL